jgi:hypothetical protein
MSLDQIASSIGNKLNLPAPKPFCDSFSFIAVADQHINNKNVEFKEITNEIELKLEKFKTQQDYMAYFMETFKKIICSYTVYYQKSSGKLHFWKEFRECMKELELKIEFIPWCREDCETLKGAEKVLSNWRSLYAGLVIEMRNDKRVRSVPQAEIYMLSADIAHKRAALEFYNENNA